MEPQTPSHSFRIGQTRGGKPGWIGVVGNPGLIGVVDLERLESHLIGVVELERLESQAEKMEESFGNQVGTFCYSYKGLGDKD